MKESGRPAKKLAPTLAPGTCCPHEFNDAEGLLLEVDCGACGGAQDLLNRRCMVGVMNILTRGALPDAILLKRFMHKRYRNEAVRTVAQAAAELSRLMRAAACASAPSDRRCRTCPCSPKRLLDGMRIRLLDDPRGYIYGRARIESVISEAVMSAACQNGSECAAQARSVSSVLTEGSR